MPLLFENLKREQISFILEHYDSKTDILSMTKMLHENLATDVEVAFGIAKVIRKISVCNLQYEGFLTCGYWQRYFYSYSAIQSINRRKRYYFEQTFEIRF